MSAPQEAHRIRGQAFETPPGQAVQRLLILAQSDQLPGKGDIIPHITGRCYNPAKKAVEDFDLNKIPGVVIISVVNQHETEICDLQTARMEQFARDNRGIAVISVSKQDPKDLAEIAEKQGLTHRLVSIDDETAAALGVGLEPDEGADEAYRTMLLRAAFVRNPLGGIAYDERVMEQMDEPNYDEVFNAAKDILFFR